MRIPKSVRSTATQALVSTINDALSTNDDISWSKQLSFASVALGVSSRDLDSSTSLASIVCSNLLKFESSLPAWTASSPTTPHVTNISPTQPLWSPVHRKLSLDDVSAASRVIASDDTVLDVTPKVLRALRLMHPGSSADTDFSPFPPDINGLSASENDVAKVLRHFAVGRIDVLRPAYLRDLTSNSTAEAGQHLIYSLSALLCRILNADVSDHAIELLFSTNPTALRKEDEGIRPIAVGNVFRRLASKVGCAASTPSLALQLSPTLTGVGIQGASEAAIHVIRRYVIDHSESGQSHQNRPIVKLDLKNACNTVRRDNLLRVCSERAPQIARLTHLAYSSQSTVLASGNPICSATSIQQGDPLGPVLFAIAVDEVASSLSSEINILYLGDVTLGVPTVYVFVDVCRCATELKEIDLEVNTSKCEVINMSHPIDELTDLATILASYLLVLKKAEHADMELLGSAILDQAVKKAMVSKLHTYLLMTHRLHS